MGVQYRVDVIRLETFSVDLRPDHSPSPPRNRCRAKAERSRRDVLDSPRTCPASALASARGADLVGAGSASPQSALTPRAREPPHLRVDPG
jgi:hypothetical protein